jgi:hypothetical protein
MKWMEGPLRTHGKLENKNMQSRSRFNSESLL